MAKKITVIILFFFISGAFTHLVVTSQGIEAGGEIAQAAPAQREVPPVAEAKDRTPEKNSEPKIDTTYTRPSFYRGIYVTVGSGKNFKKLSYLVKKGKVAHVNAMVVDVFSRRSSKCRIPASNVTYLLKNNIHPIARVVVFQDGLKRWPVSKKYLNRIYSVAEDSCKKGFKEVQFDYIRFSDSPHLRRIPLKKRYEYIEKILSDARKRLAKYNVPIAADVFGRIPLNKNDYIGQNMESLDSVVDIICPMAYPSHYTWSKKLQYDPYHTVHLTSLRAAQRTKNAEIVSWIQAFKMKLGPNRYDHYIKEQIKAVHDANIRGYFLWNARQDYTVPFAVMEKYYKKTVK